VTERARVPAAATGDRVARRLRVLARAIQAAIGAPDYERYLAHMRSRHPDAPLATRDEFLRERQEARYSRPGSRCC